MTPEELAEARHYATCYQAGYVHDLMNNLLIHIDQQNIHITELEAQVAVLKKIAEGERAAMLACAEGLYGTDDDHLIEARRQLAKEHPEAFR